MDESKTSANGMNLWKVFFAGNLCQEDEKGTSSVSKYALKSVCPLFLPIQLF